jgi:glutamyl-tRNA synthetase
MSSPDQEKIIVRFPPSPTGKMHIGNIRTILFNYLFAKKHGGEIYMRFEDTDTERSKKEYEQVALDTLQALGITYDHGPYRQSERTDLYKDAIEKLIANGKAYEGEESQDGSGDKVIRFKNPNTKISFFDIVRGEVTIDTTDFGDFVIARSVKNPLYHLTVVVDDIDMGITHVIRGEDHMTSTPRQILLIEALGGNVPHYAHLPLIIGADKKKLGKRHGATTYDEFKNLGYLPEAIINYLALLGWNAGDDREFYSMQELIDIFALEDVHKSPAMFSYEKLDSMNRHYLLQMPASDFEATVSTYLTPTVQDFMKRAGEKVVHVIQHTIIKERIDKWGDIADVCDTELAWLTEVALEDSAKIVWKKSTPEKTIEYLKTIHDKLSAISSQQWATADNTQDEENILKAAIWHYATQEGRGDVLWPLRYALTGADRSPDPFTVAFILGKEETLLRIERALSTLQR